jgi:Fe-S oxidoreductase
MQKLIDGKKLKLGGDLGKKVTYHDPCDLGRTFEIFEEPREILKAIPEVEFVEMARNRLMARCCGGGGSVIAMEPELAANMAAVRIKDAMEVGAEVIVSGCSACKDNLRKGVKAIPKDERPKIKVMDIAEIVANSIVS